ncbi:MAG: glutamate formimidoyltransferase [Actinobacteria bacterium]|nr:glutamate formimidoyltransferase [Actinomycetota bacterium]
MKRLMCVPNVSEGRNRDTIARLTAVLTEDPHITLIDASSDPDHHRSVFAYLGEAESVLAATERLAEEVFRLLDMTDHTGSHPRQGALDVVPFVPLGSTTMEEAVHVAHEFGRFIGARGVPVYYYENAATRPERVSLVDVRKGEYESLAEKLKDPAWAPDEGPAVFNPAIGSVQVAARLPLVAFNVNLRTDDLAIAERIARAVRCRDGGYRYVRAMGVRLTDSGMVQVSMNLTNYLRTPPHRVLGTIRSEAARDGVTVASTEFVGPVPAAMLEEAVRHYFQAPDFRSQQIMEIDR